MRTLQEIVDALSETMELILTPEEKGRTAVYLGVAVYGTEKMEKDENGDVHAVGAQLITRVGCMLSEKAVQFLLEGVREHAEHALETKMYEGGDAGPQRMIDITDVVNVKKFLRSLSQKGSKDAPEA